MKKLILILTLGIGFLMNAQADSLEIKKLNLLKEKEELTKVKADNDAALKKITDELIALEPPKYWKIKGINSVTINQNTFSESWIAGGVNSISLNAGLNYNFNYKKGKDIWDNQIILGYGQISNENEKPRKTEDNIFLSSTYGREFRKNWFFSGNTTFLTQFIKGFNYAKTPEALDGEQTSNFLAPGYLTVGFGVEYKPSSNFQAFFRPVTSKMTFIADEILQKKGNFGLANDGDSFRYELGAIAGARHIGKLSDNVSFDHSVNLFSNYLDHPERIDIFYRGQLNMKINKFISSQLTLDLVYDHDQIQLTQLKQTLGVGFAYNFEK